MLRRTREKKPDVLLLLQNQCPDRAEKAGASDIDRRSSSSRRTLQSAPGATRRAAGPRQAESMGACSLARPV